jgi:hypothetical protein
MPVDAPRPKAGTVRAVVKAGGSGPSHTDLDLMRLPKARWAGTAPRLAPGQEIAG